MVIKFSAKATCAGVLTNIVEAYCVTEGGEKTSVRDNAVIVTYSTPVARAPLRSPSAKEVASSTNFTESASKNGELRETEKEAGTPTQTPAERPVQETGGGEGRHSGPTSVSEVSWTEMSGEKGGVREEKNWPYLGLAALFTIAVLPSLLALMRRNPRKGGSVKRVSLLLCFIS